MTVCGNPLGREIVFPSVDRNCHVMVGAGNPLASQSRVRLAPRVPLLSSGGDMMTGDSMQGPQYSIFNCGLYLSGDPRLMDSEKRKIKSY